MEWQKIARIKKALLANAITTEKVTPEERAYVGDWYDVRFAGATEEVADLIAQHWETVEDSKQFYVACCREFSVRHDEWHAEKFGHKKKGYTVLVNGQPPPEPDFVTTVRDMLRLNDMIASQQPPGANTDNEFMAGNCCGSQFEKDQALGDYYRRIAARDGLTNVTGKKYLGTLARYPGDPRAWVSGKADVAAVCEERGWGCSGDVNVAAKGIATQPRRKKFNLKDRLRKAGLPIAS